MRLYDDVVILIPSLDPDNNFLSRVEEMVETGFSNILIVDDGSKNEKQYIFSQIQDKGYATIIHHKINRGKGCALKTGFSYILENYKNVEGVVTVDADGQHSLIDVGNVAKRMQETKTLVLGTRDFDQDNVPFKSRSGNKLTTLIFKLLYGKKINDTQTGLRGIPLSLLQTCIELQGERFEYEIKMLIEFVKRNIPIVEELIETIYYDSNRETHFNAVWDSIKIYKIMLRDFIFFGISGVTSFLVDVGIFSILMKIIFRGINPLKTILFATVVARIISSVVNFVLNKNIVFDAKNSLQKTLIRYYSLCICQTAISWLMVYFIYCKLSIGITFLKILVDTFLFIISYRIQQAYVFRK